MNKWLICIVLAAFVFGCKSKKNLDSTKAYFSVVGYLSQEVKQMDSLPLHFSKIITVDTTSDTSSISKEEFKRYANEFLNLPDISSEDNMDNYEEVNDFDEVLNTILLIYTAKKEDDEVRRETIMMVPRENEDARVQTLLINTLKSEKDSTIEKNMTWHIGKRFQIVTKIDKPGQQEKVENILVQWE